MQRVVLYPHYITAGKTVAEGRRIPKELGQLACMHGVLLARQQEVVYRKSSSAAALACHLLVTIGHSLTLAPSSCPPQHVTTRMCWRCWSPARSWGCQQSLRCGDGQHLTVTECTQQIFSEGCPLHAWLQDKHYPRDWFIRCRLRVELKRPDGTFSNPTITDSA